MLFEMDNFTETVDPRIGLLLPTTSMKFFLMAEQGPLRRTLSTKLLSGVIVVDYSVLKHFSLEINFSIASRYQLCRKRDRCHY